MLATSPYRARTVLIAGLVSAIACGGGGAGDLPPPTGGGFGMLSGQTVMVLPVQYARPMSGGWAGGARNAMDAARLTDLEITFALHEQGGRATWVLPEQQVRTLKRRPSIQVDPYVLSADRVRSEGMDLRRIEDPLYGEVRLLAALFDSRYVVWPLEVLYRENKDAPGGRLAIRALLIDARGGDVLWQGLAFASDDPPASAAALASAAQAFAILVTP